jgi:branched-chain amino acid transport system substrate-binding protein
MKKKHLSGRGQQPLKCRTICVGLAVLLPMAAVACWSSSSGEASAVTSQVLLPSNSNKVIQQKLGKIKAATGSTTTGINGHTITISGIASVTLNGQPEFSGACDGAKAAFAAANRAGGVNGYKINYLGCSDDATTPATTTQLMTQAVDQNHVFAIVPFSSGTDASAALLNKDHVPYFGFGVDPTAYCGWNGVSFGFSVSSAEGCVGAVNGATVFSDVGVAGFAKAAQLVPSKVKLAILSTQSPDSQLSGNAEAYLAKKMGMRVVYNQAAVPGPQSPQLTDYSPITQQIVASGANAFIDLVSGAPVIAIGDALKTSGYKGAWEQFSFTDASYLSIAAVANAVQGSYALTAQVGSPAFPSSQFATISHNLKAIGSSAALGLGTLTSYGSALMFLDALKHVKGSLTAEKLANVVNNNAGYTFPGFGNAICPATWPSAHVVASNCAAFIRITGPTIKPLLSLGTNGQAWLVSGGLGG